MFITTFKKLAPLEDDREPVYSLEVQKIKRNNPVSILTFLSKTQCRITKQYLKRSLCRSIPTNEGKTNDRIGISPFLIPNEQIKHQASMVANIIKRQKTRPRSLLYFCHSCIFAKYHQQLCQNTEPECDPVSKSHSQFTKNAGTEKHIKLHYEYTISKIQFVGYTTGQMQGFCNK